MRGAASSPARAPGERYVERDADADTNVGGGAGALHEGDRVEHKTLGVGVVLGVTGGADPTVTVKFSGYTPKAIKASFLRRAGR